MSTANRLHASFEALRREDSGALAVFDADRGVCLSRDELTRQIDDIASRIATAYGARLPAGARIGLRVPNSPELIAAVLACWREGWVPVPLDRELAPAEVEGIRRRLSLDAVREGIVLDERAPRAEPSDVPTASDPSDRSLPIDSSGSEIPLATDLALLKLTSGSTGEPRGVALNEAALIAGGTQILRTMGIEPTDRNLVTIPLTHSYGFDNVILTLLLAGTPAILTADLTPLRLLKVARDLGATVMPSVPFLLDLLARSSAGCALPAMRLVISAGAPLPCAIRERFHAVFGLRPRTFYGSTECGGISFDREGTADLPEGCVGSALEGVAIELDQVEEDHGRIAVRSRSVASGYVPGGDESTLGNGRFTTADIGRFDDQGRLHLLGRALDVVNVGGRKVYPAEVERVIRRIPGVRDVVVLGLGRSAVASALRAVVAAEPELTRDAILRACEQSLARYKIPRRIDLCRELPRTERGKIDRRRL